MKKLFKPLLPAVLAAAATLAVSCSKNNDDNTTRSVVNYEKKHDTAILLVTFGSTYDDPQKTYKAQIAQFEKAFPEADFFFSFTAKTCINRWLADTGEEFVTPDLYLQSFIEKNYENVYVQSLHVIPGEEFQLLRDYYVKTCYNFEIQDLVPERNPAVCGEALLHSDEDVETVGKVLVEAFAAQLKAGEAVAFIGHGNPLADYAHANVPYWEIQAFMKQYAKEKYGNDNIFVGTVDDPAMLIDYVVEELKKSGFDKTKTVNLHPLMSIAGDHANNDMANAEDPESWISMIQAAGWSKVVSVKKGLGDYPAINEVWIRHLREAITAPAGGH